eukprot:m.180246 g.180246  ORF g.180246 m.180246 type:complete len:69 (-) comp16612_c0_seq3:2663-2869(-)
MDQFVNHPNTVPAEQKFFQSKSHDLLSMRRPGDKAKYRIAMMATTAVIGSVIVGVYCLATGTGKKTRN